MTKDAMTNFINDIEGKLGKENSSLISDSLGLLVTDNEKVLENEENLKKEIEELKNKNSKLVSANSSLLQQVGQVSIKEVETKPETPSQDSDISFYDCFDKSGKFIR